MKPEEDIGSFIKSKLQSAQKTSKESTWERIQHSLEERSKKRRIAFYFKAGSASLLILLGALFMFNYMSTNTESTIKSQKDMYSKTDNQMQVSTEKSSNVLETHTSIENISKNEDGNNLETPSATHQEISETKQITVISEDFNEASKNYHPTNSTKTQVEATTSNNNTSIRNLLLKTKNEKALDTVVNRNDVPVTQTTQKIYYYYNSKNGQEISSTNKRVIDSVVEMNRKKQDSLKTKN